MQVDFVTSYTGSDVHVYAYSVTDGKTYDYGELSRMSPISLELTIVPAQGAFAVRKPFSAPDTVYARGSLDAGDPETSPSFQREEEGEWIRINCRRMGFSTTLIVR
jgi:hypothetical protein